MADLLKNWILPKIRTEVGDAVALKTRRPEEVQSSQQDVEWKADGTLVIHSTEGKCVQLVEFLSSRKPQYSAWVSDSHTLIRATFAVAATDAYKKEARQSFASGTVGSILGISEYYLTFNPAEPPSKKVTLTIQKFKHRGSGGSSTFGHPRDVEEARDVQDLVGDISAMSPVLYGREAKAAEPPSPIRSQAGSISDERHYSTRPLATQALFTLESAVIQPTSMKFGDRSYIRNKSLSFEPADKALLLSLLSNNRATENSGSKPNASKCDNRGLPLSQKVLQPVDESRSTNETSRLHSKANIQNSAQVALLSPLKDANMSSSPQVLVDQRIPNDDSSDSEKENSQQRMESTGVISTKPKVVIPQTQQNEEETPVQKPELDFNPWEVYKRVPRRHAQIPKDQLILLGRDESWFSPGSSEISAHENVPASVLLGLQTVHDRVTHPKLHGDILQNDTVIGKSFGRADSGDESVKNSGEVPNHSASSSRNLPPLSPERKSATVESHQDSEEIGDDDSDDDDFSWSASLAGDPADEELDEDPVFGPASPTGDPLPASSPQLKRGSLCFSGIGRTIDNGDSTEWRHQEVLHRSVSPSQSRADDLELPESLDAHSITGENFGINNGKATFSCQSLPVVQSSSQVFSSSPMEMESAVPYGIDEHYASSHDDVEVATKHHRIETIPSTDRRTTSKLQVVRTPHEQSHLLPPSVIRGEIEHRGGINEKGRMDNLSSDSIIPGTIDSESREYHDPSINDSSRTDSLLGHKSTERVVDDVLQSSPACSPLPPSPASHDDYDDDRPGSPNEQLLTEYMSYSQRDSPARLTKELRRNLATSFPPVNIQGKNTCSTNVLLENVSVPNHALVPATQVSSNLDSRIHDPNCGEVNVSSAANISSSLSNRQSHPNPLNFEPSQEGCQIVDTAEMVRANRLEFQRRLSYQGSKNDFKQPDLHLANTSADFLGGETPKHVQDNLRYADTLTPAILNGNDSTSSCMEDSFSKCSRDIHDTGNLNSSLPNGYITTEDLVELGSEPTGTSNLRPSLFQNAISTLGQQDRKNLYMEAEAHSHGPVEVYGNPGEVSSNLLDRFRSSYPTYVASERKFVKACTYLEWLKCDKKIAPHPSLWDDFIRAWCNEYLDYIRECKPGEKKMPGIDFYNEHVPEPKFTKRVITPANLQEALSLDPEETERARAPFRKLSTLGAGRGPISAVLSQSSTWNPEAGISTLGNIQNHQPCYHSDDDMVQAQETYYIASPASLHKETVCRKPFFETPSQLVSRNQHVPVDTAPLAPLQGTMTLSEVKTTGVESSQRNAMRLPWASSPSSPPIYLSPNDNRGTPPSDSRFSASSRVNRQDKRRSTIRRKPIAQQRGSPILGSKMVENPVKVVSTFSEGSPILGTRAYPMVEETDQAEFRTPSVPTSKHRPQRTASLPGHSMISLERNNNTSNNDDSIFSVPAKRKASPISSDKARKRPTWSEFCKGWIAKKNRPSTLRSASSSQGEVLARLEHVPPIEPETQDWNGVTTP